MTRGPEIQGSPRQPVYILVDRSAGSKTLVVAANDGLRILKGDLESDPRRFESVWLSVISFGEGGASEDVRLTDLQAFEPPVLFVGGRSDFGAALSLVAAAIARDVVVADGSPIRYHRPLVCVFTDGEPTDEWERPAQILVSSRLAKIAAFACGPDADLRMLRRLTPTVFSVDVITPSTLAKLTEEVITTGNRWG